MTSYLKLFFTVTQKVASFSPFKIDFMGGVQPVLTDDDFGVYTLGLDSGATENKLIPLTGPEPEPPKSALSSAAENELKPVTSPEPEPPKAPFIEISNMPDTFDMVNMQLQLYIALFGRL